MFEILSVREVHDGEAIVAKIIKNEKKLEYLLEDPAPSFRYNFYGEPIVDLEKTDLYNFSLFDKEKDYGSRFLTDEEIEDIDYEIKEWIKRQVNSSNEA